MRQHTHLLSPTILTEADIAHQSVKELKEVLKENNCRNIAITGTYGSGKSSIIRTLQNEVGSEYNFVYISLSTLDTNAQDIESSIVQQLLYKTDSNKSGQYRYIKPFILEEKELNGWITKIALFITAICILFEPNWLQIDWAYALYYKLFGLTYGYWLNVITDIVALIYICYFIIKFLEKVIKRVHCYTIKRLDVYNTSIEFSEKASIFNKHLDEIECFFRATKANVVVFEDLDRIDSPRSLFLKLRELNTILNDSADIKSTIKFIYAIKDDVFIGEHRTKFFDYIVSAIPAVNANNSADYLIKQYGQDDTYKISKQQWQELGSFIHGMRELYNVINEFTQYKIQIGKSLEDHKLFAITIYKNKYPQDYSLLHTKSGVLYLSINAKEHFSKEATKEDVDKYHSYNQNIDGILSIQLYGIRNNYLEELKKSYGIVGLVIKGKEYPLDKVKKTDELFRAFADDSVDEYITENNGNRESKLYDIVFDDIDNNLNNGDGFVEQLRKAETEMARVVAEKNKLESQIISLANSSLSNIISKIKDGNIALGIITDQYKVCHSLGKDDKLNTEAMDQCRMILFLLRNGYIDENYPQYISYFYPGSLTDNDNKYLQSITLGITLGYDYKLDNVDGVVKRMVTEYYDSETALNFNIVDYLSVNTEYHTFLDRILSNVRIAPKFMIEYDKVGANCQEFFKHILIEYDWFLEVAFNDDNIELQDELVLLFLKYCPVGNANKYRNYSNRLNNMFGVISNNIVILDIDHLCGLLEGLKLQFTRIFNGAIEEATILYNFVLDHSLYAINIDNVKTILGENFKLKTITSIIHNRNKKVYANLWSSLGVIYKFIPDTSVEEEEDAIKTMINDSRIPFDFKKQYVMRQNCTIKNLNDINIEVEGILFSTDHIAVLWKNIFDSFSHNKKQLKDYHIEFIIRHCSELKNQKIEYDNEDIVMNAFDQLFANNSLPEDVYAQLLPLFPYEFANDDDLSELSAKRMDIVISNNKYEYGDDSYALVQEYFSPYTLSLFILNNFKAFMDSDHSANNEVYCHILESDKIDIVSKIQLLELISEIDNDSFASRFADSICRCYLEINFTADNNYNLIINAINLCTSWELKIRSINRINQILTYSRSREAQMVASLGGEYLKLNTTYGAASFDINEHNRELLSFLKSNRHFVSEFKERDNQFKVSFLHSC